MSSWGLAASTAATSTSRMMRSCVQRRHLHNHHAHTAIRAQLVNRILRRAPPAFSSSSRGGGGRRRSLGGSGNAPAPGASALANTNTPSTVSPWQEQRDPNGSDLVYYWNTETNETTPLGVQKPRNWVEVADPNGTQLSYWWDTETGETTALGALRPSDLVHVPVAQQLQQQQQQVGAVGPFQRQAAAAGRPQTFMGSMVTYFTLGIGVTMGMVLVRAIIG